MLPNDVGGTLFALTPGTNKPLAALSEKYAPPGAGFGGGGPPPTVKNTGASFNTGFN